MIVATPARKLAHLWMYLFLSYPTRIRIKRCKWSGALRMCLEKGPCDGKNDRSYSLITQLNPCSTGHERPIPVRRRGRGVSVENERSSGVLGTLDAHREIFEN